MKKLLLLLVILACFISINSQVLIIHKSNITYYDTTKKCPVWCKYVLKDRKGQFSRPTSFHFDPKLQTKNQTSPSQLESVDAFGYDIGHLSPNDDFRFDSLSNIESMYVTNVAPQISSFNRGPWKRLENYTRHLSTINDSVIVITSVIVSNKIINGVYVPDFFVKQLIVKGDTVTYSMPNSKGDNKFETYKVPNFTIDKTK